MISPFWATYGTVFAAEIVGDKLLYTTGILAVRFRPSPIFFGMALAFTLKMGAAVLLGNAVSALPPVVVASLTALSFFAVALAVWRKSAQRGESHSNQPASRAAAISFAVIFFSEWGDIGQITAATLAARYGAPLTVWLGAVCAMVTKGLLAASLGSGIRPWIQRHVSPQALRYCGVGLLLLLGFFSVIETVRLR